MQTAYGLQHIERSTIHGLHAFGNNSAESVPIWMKSEKNQIKFICHKFSAEIMSNTLYDSNKFVQVDFPVSQICGLAIGRDWRSSDSLRGIIFFKKR